MLSKHKVPPVSKEQIHILFPNKPDDLKLVFVDDQLLEIANAGGLKGVSDTASKFGVL